jgi:hypothetical protein
MRGIRFWSSVCGGFFCAVSTHAQQTLSVGINKECKTGQASIVSLVASTYHSDPFCSSYATAPGGGCTQWKLFRDGQLVTSRYTVPAGGGTQIPANPPLDFYNSGRFPLLLPGTYQIKMSYSRKTCTGQWIFENCTTTIYVNETPTIIVKGSDFDPSTWLSKCPFGSFDGANCFLTVKPPGGFMYERGFYIPASPTHDCPVGGFDGANCYLMAKPATGFIWMNGFYVKPGPGGSCSMGGFDGANCFILKAPFGTKAFEWGGNFYVSTLPTCSQGSFDGANCLLASAPAGSNPFEWNGNFYFTPRPQCP